jgi:hypothetical protein
VGEKRKTDTSKSANSDSDTDTGFYMPKIPTKKHRSDFKNGKSLVAKGNDNGPTSTYTVNVGPVSYVKERMDKDTEDKDTGSSTHSDVVISLKRRVLGSVENSKSRSDGSREVITIDIDTPDVTPLESPTIHPAEHAATQLKEIPKARVSFASARTSKPGPKQFVPLDPASIRRGFQEGGASLKEKDLKKGTYIMLI